ncbi:hypothetical protein SAMN05720762_10761 [Fibrobacter sp. UWH4]|nr:hypothetical protein SAMN05720762_10761 [Fibrobacter sp. UWH4]
MLNLKHGLMENFLVYTKMMNEKIGEVCYGTNNF